MKYLLRIKNRHILRYVTSPVNRDRLRILTSPILTPLLYYKIFNVKHHINILRLKKNNNNNKMSLKDIFEKK